MIYTNAPGGAALKPLGRNTQHCDAEKRPLVNFAYQPEAVIDFHFPNGSFWPTAEV